MLKFNKITGSLSEVIMFGEMCGTLERLGSHYVVEVYYNSINIPIENKRIIQSLIKKIYSRLKSREYRELVSLYKNRNSILHKDHTYLEHVPISTAKSKVNRPQIIPEDFTEPIEDCPF